MSIVGWLDKQEVVYTYNEILFTLKRKKKRHPVVSHAITLMNLKGITLSEIYQFIKRQINTI